jgi:FMN phosphatase YigB (HAD superfamily)
MEKYKDRFFAEVRENLNRLNIKVILFDLDDTLIYTHELFKKYMDEYIEAVSAETGLSLEVVRADLERLDSEEYKKVGVNPERWVIVARRMSEELAGYGEASINNINILEKIYTDNPRVKSGVFGLLEILKEVGVRMCLVTHANEAWTERKLDSTGLAKYFEVIKIVDENRHKGAQDWLETINEVNESAEECLILGDSLSGDVIAGASIGARTMWLHTGSTWSVYRTGEVPETTVHLDEVTQLLSALDGLR